MAKYSWPTDEGWFMIAALTIAGFVAGGWVGALIMFGFFALVSVSGNLLERWM